MNDTDPTPITKTAIVFGASGFIGSHVVEQLLLAGYSVTAVVRASANTSFLRTTTARLRVTDFADEMQLAELISGHELVYNCLANPRMHQPLADLRQVEVELTEKLVRAAAAAKAQRFLQLSTIQAYGFERPPTAIDENFPLKPVYNFSRVCAEREQTVINEARRLGLDYVLLRPVNALGKRDTKLQPIIKAHLQGLFMMANKNARFSAIDVRDIGRAMALLGTAKEAANNIYLVKGFDTSWRELKQQLDQQTGHTARELHLPKTLAHAIGWLGEQLPYRWNVPITRFAMAVMATDTLFDDSKIHELGFTPLFGLADAVRDSLAKE